MLELEDWNCTKERRRRNNEDQLTQKHGTHIASNASIAYSTYIKQR